MCCLSSIKKEAQESNQAIREAQYIGKKKFITSPCKHGMDNGAVNLFQLYLYQKCLFLQSVVILLPTFRCPFYVALRRSELLDGIATCQRFCTSKYFSSKLWTSRPHTKQPLSRRHGPEPLSRNSLLCFPFWSTSGPGRKSHALLCPWRPSCAWCEAACWLRL